MKVFDQLISYFKKKWKAYKDQQKLDAMYARLDANKTGRYSHKEHLKELERQKKMQFKKNRDYAVEKKATEKKK
jgi:hypothetical protein